MEKRRTRQLIPSLFMVILMLIGSLSGVMAISPDDTLWNANNTWNLIDAQIDDVWDLDSINDFTHMGSQSITVAVLDSGLHWDPDTSANRHPDIDVDLVWKNPNEEEGDANADGSPGLKLVDDDGDNKIDEDKNGVEQWERDQSGDIEFDEYGEPVPNDDWTEGWDDDDDENGYIDDLYGYNFVDNVLEADPIYGTVEDLYDEGWWYSGTEASPDVWENHGTRVTGLLAASVNNGEGVAGTSPNIKVMILKVADDEHQSHDSEEDGYITPDEFAEMMAEAITYAENQLADVICISKEFDDNNDDDVQEALEDAYEAGIVIFAAVGNDGARLDEYQQPDPPVSIPFPASSRYVCGIGALDSGGKRASYSNWPKTSTWSDQTFYNYPEIVAPCGDDGNDKSIKICNEKSGTQYYDWPGQNDDLSDGTHYAMPLAAGTGALMLSYKPTLCPDEVRRILQITADDIVNPEATGTYYGPDRFTGYGRLDAHEALSTAVYLKPGFEHGENYQDMNMLFPTKGGMAPYGYEPAMDMDTNGYIHAVMVQERTNDEICYIQLNPNQDIRSLGSPPATIIRIESGAACQNTDSLDPAICIDYDPNTKKDIVNIIWREASGNNLLWYTRLDTNGNTILSPTAIQNAPTALADLNIVQSIKTANLYYLVYTNQQASPDTVQIRKINSAGATQGNVATLSNQGRLYYMPSADVCLHENGQSELVVVTCLEKRLGYFGWTSGLYLWVVQNDGNWPNVITTQVWLPDDDEDYQFMDPDVDVDYNGRGIHIVYREIPLPPETKEQAFPNDQPATPYTSRLLYRHMTLAGTIDTFTNQVIDLTKENSRYFYSPQVMINILGEVRVSYQNSKSGAQYVEYISLKPDGQTVQHITHSKPVTVDSIPNTQPSGTTEFFFTFPQLLTTEMGYSSNAWNRQRPYDYDGNFYLMFFKYVDEQTDVDLDFYTTKQFANGHVSKDNDVVDTAPDIDVDEFGFRHIVWVEDTGTNNRIRYQQFETPANGYYGATPDTLRDPQIDVELRVADEVGRQLREVTNEAEEYYAEDRIHVLIVWVRETGTGDELWYNRVSYNPEDFSDNTIHGLAQVAGTSSHTTGFNHVRIKAYRPNKGIYQSRGSSNL